MIPKLFIDSELTLIKFNRMQNILCGFRHIAFLNWILNKTPCHMKYHNLWFIRKVEVLFEIHPKSQYFDATYSYISRLDNQADHRKRFVWSSTKIELHRVLVDLQTERFRGLLWHVPILTRNFRVENLYEWIWNKTPDRLMIF